MNAGKLQERAVRVNEVARVNYEDIQTRRKLTTVVLLVGLCVSSFLIAEVQPAALFQPDAIASIWNFIRSLFPPDVSLQFLSVVATAGLQTLAIAVVSTVLSVLFGLLAGVFATPILWERGVLLSGERPGISSFFLANCSRLVRAFLGFLRAVPDLVWGLIFVVAFGLGPLAGTLALTVSYTGVLGRVYAHLFEDVVPNPLEALHAAGATRFQVFLKAIWPQAAPSVTAYTLYSFECCVRAASVLGFIGAGGIGYEINVSMRLFEYGQVSTLIVALILLVAITDRLSRIARRRLQSNSSGPRFSYSKPDGKEMRASFIQRMVSWLAGMAAIFLSLYFTGFLGGGLTDSRTIGRVADFISRMFPPNLDPNFLSSLPIPLLQTIAISVAGTLIGIVIGAVLSLPATSTLVLRQGDQAGRGTWTTRFVGQMFYGLARMILNALRSIPEMLWVLICVIAVGLGPFAGTLAIGLHTGGVLGKLYAETLEEVPGQAIEAMRAIGARPFQILLWAIWPQAKNTLISYTILRWEMNLRASTILGLVGGGGLGQMIYYNIQLGFYSNLSTLIIVVYVLVIATDWISHSLRSRSLAQSI